MALDGMKKLDRQRITRQRPELSQPVEQANNSPFSIMSAAAAPDLRSHINAAAVITE